MYIIIIIIIIRCVIISSIIFVVTIMITISMMMISILMITIIIISIICIISRFAAWRAASDSFWRSLFNVGVFPSVQQPTPGLHNKIPA